METNWNQLIERYLQHELSDEGLSAFEQELKVNPALREELEMHQLIRSAAKRASQRTLVQQAGKAYLRTMRIKQFTIGVAVTVATTAGIVYWVQSKKEDKVPQPKKELVAANQREAEESLAEESMEETAGLLKDSVSNVQDGTVVDSELIRSTISHTLPKVKMNVYENSKTKIEAPEELKIIPVTFGVDSVPGPGVPSNLRGNAAQHQPQKEEALKPGWINLSELYDSVGRFNDLYCGYALVMDDAKIGFVDRKGNLFIPLIYDQIVVTSNIQSSKDKHKKKGKKKVLYIPKRSGSEVQYCEENNHPFLEPDSIK